jgi:hypothetical protein
MAPAYECWGFRKSFQVRLCTVDQQDSTNVAVCTTFETHQNTHIPNQPYIAVHCTIRFRKKVPKIFFSIKFFLFCLTQEFCTF